MKEYTSSKVAWLIDEYIHDERNRAILKRRLLDGVYFEPLAEEFHLSVSRIKTIVYRGQEIIFRHLDDG